MLGNACASACSAASATPVAMRPKTSAKPRTIAISPLRGRRAVLVGGDPSSVMGLGRSRRRFVTPAWESFLGTGQACRWRGLIGHCLRLTQAEPEQNPGRAEDDHRQKQVHVLPVAGGEGQED